MSLFSFESYISAPVTPQAASSCVHQPSTLPSTTLGTVHTIGTDTAHTPATHYKHE
ncbi:hypothetical protein E2C01_031505 [Portunus trituberculatus]|uniref:Uncharacterized protein n=1 Tax=Portunus trituberculatus TaxID=210409 RepID=A0A5B7EXU9_PORTR|nr:hypothetical protein [Portunus trituberculatus]